MLRRTAIAGLIAAVLLGAAAAQASDRAVLVEMYGGTWCGYCPTAYAALQLLREEYTEDQFVPIYLHVGGGDPFVTGETMGRAGAQGVGPVPHLIFDSIDEAVGVLSTPELTANWYRPKINACLAIPSPVEIRSWGLIDGANSFVTAVIKATDTLDYDYLKAQFVLYEDDILYDSKEWDWTVRDCLPPETGITISAPGESIEITRTFTPNAAWAEENLRLVTFLESTTAAGAPLETRMRSSCPIPTGSR